MELRIYNENIEMIGICDEIDTVLWTARYWDIGEFSIYGPATEANISLLKQGNLVIQADSENTVVINGVKYYRAGQIDNIEISVSPENAEMIEVRGKLLSNWLSKRILLPGNVLSITDVPCSQIISTLIDASCVHPTSYGYNDARRFPATSIYVNGHIDNGFLADLSKLMTERISIIATVTALRTNIQEMYKDLETQTVAQTNTRAELVKLNNEKLDKEKETHAEFIKYAIWFMGTYKPKYTDLNNKIIQISSKIIEQDKLISETRAALNIYTTKLSIIEANISRALNENEDDESGIDYKAEEYKNLGTEIRELSIRGKMGYDVLIDPKNKKRLIYLYKGIDHSSNTDKPIIFSRDLGNLISAQYTADTSSYKNCAYIKGTQYSDGSIPIAMYSEGEIGLGLSEVYVDASDIANKESEDSPEINIAKYINLLTTRGKTELMANYREYLSFQNDVNLNNVKYGDDFNLGDVITCVDTRWELAINNRITEISITSDSSGKSVSVTFGDNTPTLLQKVRKIV